MRCFLMASIATVLSLALSPAFATPPTGTAYRPVGAITVDGSLNEPSWQNANSVLVSSMKVWNSQTQTWNDQTATQSTAVKILWDNNYLYLGYTCQDKDIYSTIVGRDKTTWNQDVVEVFVKTQPSSTAYNEWEFTPNGQIWDGHMTDVKTPDYTIAQQWNSLGTQVATTKTGTINNKSDTDTGWTVEAKIPWTDIYSGTVSPQYPVDGSQIVLNVCRGDLTTPDNLGTPQDQIDGNIGGGNTQLSSWSPLVAPLTFHEPANFGTVTFSTSYVPEPATLALLALGALALRKRRP